MTNEPQFDDEGLEILPPSPTEPLAFIPPAGAPGGPMQPAPGATASVFSGVFDLGFAATPAEGTQNLINSAALVAQQIEQQINACVLRIFAGQRVTQSKCRNVITDCVQSQLRIVRDLCDNDQACIAREMHRLMSVAWQTAAQFGCSDAPETTPTPPIRPIPIPVPPAPPIPAPPIEFPPPERPPIIPPPVPPRPPRIEPPPRKFPEERPPRERIDDKPLPVPPGQPPRPPIGVEPPFPQCPPDSPLECWLGLPPAPPRIVPFQPGCALTYTVMRQGDTIHIIGPKQFLNQCQNGAEWFAGANAIFDRLGVPANARQCRTTPNQGHPSSALSCVGFHAPVQPPPPLPPPAPPGAPGAQCPVCCCCPCECPEKEPPEEKPEPEPPEEPKGLFDCWFQPTTGAYYVLQQPQPKRSPTDVSLGTFDTAAKAQEHCDKNRQQDDKPPVEGGPPPSVINPLDWCNVDIHQLIASSPFITEDVLRSQFGQLLGLYDANRRPTTPTLLRTDDPIRKPIGEGIADIGRELLRLAFVVPNWLANVTPCESPSGFGLRIANVLLGMLAKYISDDIDEIKRPLEYWQNYLCPTILPNPGESTSAFLANQISDTQLQSWVRANGYCWEPWQRIIQAQRSKPVPIELREMRRREIITPEQYHAMMRELGYLEDATVSRLWEISKVVPPYSDLVRMMVRDAEDQQLVTRFGMDTDFTVKYDGQLKRWFEHQGIPEIAARYLWRAHWSIPSPSQLYTMFHRLSRLPVGDPRKVDISDVETALKQQDILPYWIPKLLEISYLPINRSDATQAFIHGVMNEAELKESYLQNGYNESSADRMVAKTYQQRIRRYWRNPPIRAFIQGGLSEVDARAALQFEGLDIASQDVVIARSKGLRRARLRQRCIAAIQKRFFAGEFDGAGATAEMIGFGVDNDAAIEFVEFWRCELASKGKHFSASVLCGLLERGLITQQDFIARARRLGWSQDDALILASDCLARINVRATKAAEIAARRAESEQRRKDSQLKSALRETAAAQKREAQIIEAARRAGERREDLILRASERMAGKIESTVADQVPIAKAIWQQLRNVNRLNIDDALQAVVRSAEIFQIDGGFSWAELAENYALGTEEIEGQTNGTVTE